MDLPPSLYLWQFGVLSRRFRYETLFSVDANIQEMFPLFALVPFSYWVSALITRDNRRVFEQSITLIAREVNLKTISGTGNTKALMGEAVKKKKQDLFPPLLPRRPSMMQRLKTYILRLAVFMEGKGQ